MTNQEMVHVTSCPFCGLKLSGESKTHLELCNWHIRATQTGGYAYVVAGRTVQGKPVIFAHEKTRQLAIKAARIQTKISNAPFSFQEIRIFTFHGKVTDRFLQDGKKWKHIDLHVTQISNDMQEPVLEKQEDVLF